jgi:HK97 family phage portal protein
MGRLAAAVTQTLLSPFSTFWPQDWNASLVGGVQARAANINPDSAMGVMAYYSGVRFLSETTASLPLIVYRQLADGGKERATDHPMYTLLHDQANPEMTAFTWKETVMGHAVGWGNGYSERQLDARGRTIALWPLRPDRMRVLRAGSLPDGTQGPLIYRYQVPGGAVVDLPPARVFHIRGLGYDGLVGYSPVEIMRRALRLALAAEEYGERTFDNDGRPGVILTHPKTLSDKARENLEKSWARNHEGLTNAQRSAVLEEGITVTDIGFPPADTQFLESRKFGVTEIARGLRIPPHILYDLDRSTNNNIEQQSIELVSYSLRSWFVRWEQQYNADLLGIGSGYFAEHLVDALLRGDALTRAQALWIQRQAGVLNADEWRAIENRNKLPNGDGEVYLQPLNMPTVGEPPLGAREDIVKPVRGVPNPDVPGLTVVPDTAPAPVKPATGKSSALPPDPFAALGGIGVPDPASTVSSRNGTEKVPA